MRLALGGEDGTSLKVGFLHFPNDKWDVENSSRIIIYTVIYKPNFNTRDWLRNRPVFNSSGIIVTFALEVRHCYTPYFYCAVVPDVFREGWLMISIESFVVYISSQMEVCFIRQCHRLYLLRKNVGSHRSHRVYFIRRLMFALFEFCTGTF